MFVLNSSVILAIIRSEAGLETALRYSRSAAMSAVNVAEVVTKCVEQNLPEDIALDIIHSCGIDIKSFDERLAVTAGKLRRGTPKGVLSLGDRACIATAIELDGTAVTADRVWATLDLNCAIELVR